MTARIKYTGYDILGRFDRYKKQNAIGKEVAIESLRYCFRYIKRGNNCALIVSDMNNVKMIMELLIVEYKLFGKLNIIKKKSDGFVFDNGTEFRVLPTVNRSLATNMLGLNVKIVDGKFGDPKMDTLRKMFK